MSSSVSDFLCIACGSKLVTFLTDMHDDRYGCPGTYSILECSNCGHMSTDPQLTEADLPALYSNYYPRKHVDYLQLERDAARVAEPFGGLRRWFLGSDNQGHYGAKPGEKVLDVGCGSCLSLLEMRAMGVEPYGIEADPNVAAIAKHFGLNVHIGNVYDRPFSEIKFDLVVLNQVIEHVPDPLEVLRVCKQLIRPGGRIVLAFPNTGSWHRKMWARKWINWHIPYHQNHFNVRSITSVAEKAGLNVASARTITPTVWSIVQLKTFSEKKSLGQTSPVWEKEKVTQLDTGHRNLLKSGLRDVVMIFAKAVLGITNRTMDAFGYGDSLLIQLKTTEL